MKSKNRKMRMWGGLTRIKSDTEVRGDGVEINVWSKDWADPTEMYNLGFELINSLDSNVYIVPAAGYYADYLNAASLYANWKPNVFKSGNLNTTIPAGDPQMIGGAYALWNDSIDTRGNGVTDYDVFDRIYQPMSALSEKLWGEGTKTYNEVKATTAKVSTAPNTNPYHEIESTGSTYAEYNFDKEDGSDASKNKYNAVSAEHATYTEGKVGKALSMESDTCIETPLDKSPAGTSLSFWVKKAAGGSSDEQVLFEGSSTLGDYTIKAVQKNTGKVGYSREGYDYSFDYTLPEDEWVHLTIKGYKDKAELYVNDSDTAIPAVMDTATKLGTQYRLATLNIPIKYIGSTTGNSFNGLIDEIELTNDQDDSIIPTTDFSFTCDNEQNPAEGSDGPISNAFDGDTSTLWHSQYSPSIKALPATFTVDMGKEYKINKLTYVPRQSGGANGYITSYDLYVKKAESDDWTQVVTDGVWASDTKEKTAKFNTVDARYIKFVAKEGSNGFATASEFHIHQVLNEEEQEVTKAQEALNEAVNDSSIKGIYEAGNADGTYTSASWTAFKEAYEAAKAPSEGASAEELKTLLTNLQSAKAGLKNAAVESAKETLKAEVDKAENKNIYEAGNADGTYTKDSWTAFKEAYEAAKAPSEGASAEELKTLLTNLQNAKAGLKKSQTETPPTPNQTETPATPGQTEKPSTPEKPTVVQKVSKNVTYRVLDTKKKTAAVVGVGGKKGKKVTSVTIAKTVKINGVTYKVTKIGKNAFKGCKYLKKITIGSNVKKIEKGAFANCRKLASINMKKANGITSIGSKAFSRINSKAKVSVPSKKLSKYTRMLKKAGLPKKAVIKK